MFRPVARPGLDERDDIRDIVRVDVEKAGRRVERGAGPVRPAVEAGDDDRPLPAGRVEGRSASDLAQLCQDRRTVGFADVGDVRLIEGLGGERRRLHGDRLRRRCLLAGDIRGRDRLLLDVEERPARLAVEQEDIAGLRHLGDGVDRLAAVRDRDEVRIDRQVVVPDVVMQRLEMPATLARPGVERDRAIGEQVRRRAGRRRRSRRPPSRARRRPCRAPTSTLIPPQAFAPPRSFQDSPPQVESPTFARAGHGPEPPDLLAGADVERPDIAGRGDAGPLVAGDARG